MASPHKASFMNVYRKVLAVQSGGRVVDGSLDWVQQIEGCVRDAGPFYRISFDPLPADHPNEYHDLKVVVNRPGLDCAHQYRLLRSAVLLGRSDSCPGACRSKNSNRCWPAPTESQTRRLAKQLSELTLTERLSEHRLSFSTQPHGKRVRQELRILADSSAFLDPPADEIPTDAPPDLAAQQHMLSLTTAYLNTAIGKLPDLFARRTTVRYQETPMYLEAETSVNYQPLHLTDTSTTTVRYHNGAEIAETKPPKQSPMIRN